MTCDACNQSTSGRCWAHTATITLPATPDPHTEPRTPTGREMLANVEPRWRNVPWDPVSLELTLQEILAIEAEASTGADAPRHYPNDNCGDANHDAILEAWYERANRILDDTGADAAARSSEGVDAQTADLDRALAEQNIYSRGDLELRLAPSSEAVEARPDPLIFEAMARAAMRVVERRTPLSPGQPLVDAVADAIEAEYTRLATASSREGDPE